MTRLTKKIEETDREETGKKREEEGEEVEEDITDEEIINQLRELKKGKRSENNKIENEA